MQLVRSRFDREIRDRSLPSSVLRANCAGLQFEFADCLRAGAELVIAAAIQVETPERHSFDQNLV